MDSSEAEAYKKAEEELAEAIVGVEKAEAMLAAAGARLAETLTSVRPGDVVYRVWEGIVERWSVAALRLDDGLIVVAALFIRKDDSVGKKGMDLVAFDQPLAPPQCRQHLSQDAYFKNEEEARAAWEARLEWG